MEKETKQVLDVFNTMLIRKASLATSPEVKQALDATRTECDDMLRIMGILPRRGRKSKATPAAQE